MTDTILVTGAAGFIGSNLVRGLNEKGHRNIIAVDDLAQGDKFHNLRNCAISDYLDKDEFLEALLADEFDGVLDAIFHQGACVDTLERNGRKMMEDNYRYSRALLDHALEQEIPLIYASSAAVYGASMEFVEDPVHEQPLNVYGYSKLLFDQVVRQQLPTSNSQIVGLRYFNVYGPHEQHKGTMASVAYHAYHQYCRQGRVELFVGSGTYGDGEQRRDFIFVDDIVHTNIFFYENPQISGVFNLGTGRAESFNDLASHVINACRACNGQSHLSREEMHRHSLIRYIPFPGDLQDRYQSFTQADISQLRKGGFSTPFTPLAEGVMAYVQAMYGQGR